MAPTPDFYILPAEYIGEAAHGPDGKLRIGEGEHVVEIDLARTGLKPEGYCCWWNTHAVSVYVRRSSEDLSVLEIHMTRHDGLAQEALDQENEEAERYPLGPKEYWRGKMVGVYSTGSGSNERLMTEEDFEEYWGEMDYEDDDSASENS